MAQDLITSLDPYNGVCEKFENGKRRMHVILSPEEVRNSETMEVRFPLRGVQTEFFENNFSK